MPVFSGMTTENAECRNEFAFTVLEESRTAIDRNGLAGHEIAER
jgi:hypothetical protein